MNIFKSIDTSVAFNDATIKQVLNAIRTGYLMIGTKMLVTGAVNASKESKFSEEKYRTYKNKYTYLKTTSVLTWCPNATFNDRHRHLANLERLTGLVYYDIDGVDAEATKEIVSKLPFVYAAWKSLSGTGIGFLVKSDFTAEDFRDSYYALYAYFKVEHNLEVDRVSDYTRCNVFSYDEKLYINEEATKIEAESIAQMLITYKDAIPKLKKHVSTRPLQVQAQTDTNFSKLSESLSSDATDYETKIKIAINYAIKSKGEYKDGNKHNFKTSFLGTCTSMGLPYGVVIKGFEDYANSINQRIDYDSTENMFDEFDGQAISAYGEITKFSVEPISSKKPIIVDKYLDNQLPTSFNKNTILIAPTGAGKSTFVMNNLIGKRIVVCPNTAILKNFKVFEGVSVYYGDEKSATFTDIILTTQDSFANLVSKLEKDGLSLLDYTIVIDEFHTLVTAAHYSYKYKAVNDVVRILNIYPCTVLGLTATPITTITNSFYEEYEIVTVKQKEDVKRLLILTEFDDYKSFVVEKALENYKNKAVTVIYRNDKRNIELLSAALRMQGLTTVTVNADTKETEEYKKLVQEGNLDVDVILTTCLLREGVSLKVDGNKTSVDYIVTGDCHYTEINQLSSRVRNATSITITLASSKTTYKNYKLPFFFQETVKEIDEANEFLLKKFNTTSLTKVETRLDQKLFNSAIKYDLDKKQYVVDEIYKDYLIYAAETKVCSINPLYSIAMLLQDERFDVHIAKVVYSEEHKECIEEAQKQVKVAEVKQVINFEKVVNECPVGKTNLEKLSYIKENGDAREKALAYYTEFCLTRMIEPCLNQAIEQAQEFENCVSNRKFNEFKTKLELTGLFRQGIGNSVSVKLFQEIKMNVMLNKEYTSEQIHSIFTKAIEKSEAKEYLKMSKTKATQWFNLMGMSYSSTSKDQNRKTVRTYRLERFGLLGYNYQPITQANLYPSFTTETTTKIKGLLSKWLEEKIKAN